MAQPLVVMIDRVAPPVLPALAASLPAEVVSASSVVDAISLGSERHADAILLRPGPSSRDVSNACEEIAASYLKGVPLVVIGGDLAQATQAYARGAADFWREPVGPDVLRLAAPVLLRSERPTLQAIPARRPARVLIADDDQFFLRRVADLVEANGYTVLTAKTGLEALTQLDAVPPPTLCVMDLFMPGLGGTELLQRMRDNPLWKGIPVIAVSGARRDKALVDELERLGVQDFVDKQVVSIDSLGALVEEYLGPARRRSPHKRVSTFALAEFRRIPTEPWLTGLVCNLSLGGAFLRTLLPPKADQLIQVRIDLGPTRITTACRVAWSRSLLTGHSEPFGMGVDFADLGADALKTLGDWVASASTLPGV